MAASAGGTVSGAAGITSGPPDTVEIVTRSPLSIVSRGGSRASKYPQCTLSGPGSRWMGIGFGPLRARPPTQHVFPGDPTGDQPGRSQQLRSALARPAFARVNAKGASLAPSLGPRFRGDERRKTVCSQRRHRVDLDQERLLHETVDDQQRVGRIDAVRKQVGK